MAAVNDFFYEPVDSKTSEPLPTIVSSDRTVGSTSLSVNSLEGWGEVFNFTTYQETDGKPDLDTVQRFKGRKQDNTTIVDIEIRGTRNTGNLIGDKVLQLVEIANFYDNNQGLLVEHNPDGSHKLGSLPSVTPNPAGPPGTPLSGLNIDGTNYAINTTINTDPWVPAPEGWRFVNYNAETRMANFAIASSAITKYGVGNKVRFTQNSITNYGIVTGRTSTQINIFADQAVDSSTLTNKSFSYAKCPPGFPLIGSNPYSFLTNNEGWEIAKGATLNQSLTRTNTTALTLETMPLGPGAWELHFFAKANLTSISKAQSTTLVPGSTLLSYGTIRTFLNIDGARASATAEDAQLINIGYGVTTPIAVEFHHVENVHITTSGAITADAIWDNAASIGLTLTFSDIIIRARSLLV